MKDTLDHTPRTRKLLLGTTALLAGTSALSSAATQFVAWRVHYHPALGTPWFRHVYAPWSWITWMQAPWAPHAKATFGLMDAGLMGVVSLGMFAGLVVSGNRRRKPVKHEGVHGTARFHVGAGNPAKPGCCPAPGQPQPGSMSAAGRMRRAASTTSAMTGRSTASSSRRRAAARAWATSCRRCCPGPPAA